DKDQYRARLADGCNLSEDSSGLDRHEAMRTQRIQKENVVNQYTVCLQHYRVVTLQSYYYYCN
ncbi:MAG: hypothetical protein ACFCU6_10690, partial [Balneolaceae bacterium]